MCPVGSLALLIALLIAPCLALRASTAIAGCLNLTCLYASPRPQHFSHRLLTIPLDPRGLRYIGVMCEAKYAKSRQQAALEFKDAQQRAASPTPTCKGSLLKLLTYCTTVGYTQSYSTPLWPHTSTVGGPPVQPFPSRGVKSVPQLGLEERARRM